MMYGGCVSYWDRYRLDKDVIHLLYIKRIPHKIMKTIEIGYSEITIQAKLTTGKIQQNHPSKSYSENTMGKKMQTIE